MPIEALPQNTIRAIGSTSVISDVYAVVKELVDNSLDASATSLQIEVSQNTVDVIQLKDNGHGIFSEDHPYVCKRAFTSKIQTIDDLKNIGGSSLGFRGEALASIAEISGALTVTTRVESEIAGLCLTYGRNGELTGKQRTSHLRGTTVRITDFLKHIPVRRQTALKGAVKNLARIKKLLQAYAIAQPHKRLSLKVIKAKNQNGNWTYAPSVDPSLSDAAFKVAGTEVSSSCVLKQLASQTIDESIRGSSDQRKYEAIAFLPKSEFDTTKTNNSGQYISVDGRPLSSSRGVGHEIVKLFKTYVRFAASKNDSSKPVSDPFLCLQIRCPRGTYDINIEPAKDDLLFEDRGLVLALVEDLFRDHYGGPEKAQKTTAIESKESTSSEANGGPAAFELLMAKKPAANVTTRPQSSEDSSKNGIPDTPLLQRQLQSDHMVSPAKISGSDIPETPDHSATARIKRSSFVNPWSISRINASFQTPRRECTSSNLESPEELSSGSLQIPSRTESGSRNLQHPTSVSDLTSPSIVRLSSGSPVRRRRENPQELTMSLPETNRMSGARRAERERDRELYGNGALDTWFQRTTQVSLQQTPAEEALTQVTDESPLSLLAQQRFGSPTGASPRSPQLDGQNGVCSDSLSEADFHTTFPRRDNRRFEDQDEQITGSMDSGRGFPVLDRWAAQLHEGVNQEELSDLEKALDFEKRKREAIRNSRIGFKNKEALSGTRSTPVSRSPHRSRYLAAKAALTSSQTSTAEPVSVAALSPQDPRTCLIRQQRDQSADKHSMDGQKPRKQPTNRLPFERIPDGSKLHDLGMTCLVGLSSDTNTFKRNLREDLYATSEVERTAFSASYVETCIPLWQERLMLIMDQQYKSKDQLKPMTFDINLAAIISQHLKNVDANGE